jgi:hypothetical protein
MLPGIRCVPRGWADKLDPMSRIDFSRTYTVEHDMKVYDFGSIQSNYMSRLKNHWVTVLLKDNPHHLGGSLATTHYESEDSDEEEEDSDMELDIEKTRRSYR